MMQQRKRYRIAFEHRIHRQLAAMDARIRDAVVAQCSQGRQAAGIDEAAVVVEDVDVRAEGPDFLAGDQAEGFGGEGLRAAEGGLEDAGEVRFEVALSVEGGGVSFWWVGGGMMGGD